MNNLPSGLGVLTKPCIHGNYLLRFMLNVRVFDGLVTHDSTVNTIIILNAN